METKRGTFLLFWFMLDIVVSMNISEIYGSQTTEYTTSSEMITSSLTTESLSTAVLQSAKPTTVTNVNSSQVTEYSSTINHETISYSIVSSRVSEYTTTANSESLISPSSTVEHLSTSTALNSVSWTSESITSTKSTTTNPTTEIITNIDTTTENPTSETVTNIESTPSSATETSTSIESTTINNDTETATNIESTTINPATETATKIWSTTESPTTEGSTNNGTPTDGPTTETVTNMEPTTTKIHPTTEPTTTVKPTSENSTPEAITTIESATENPTTETTENTNATTGNIMTDIVQISTSLQKSTSTASIHITSSGSTTPTTPPYISTLSTKDEQTTELTVPDTSTITITPESSKGLEATTPTEFITTLNIKTTDASSVQSTGAPPEPTTSTITETTQITTTTDKTTTEATTTAYVLQTACPTSSFGVRPNVSLNEECGYHSLVGICNDSNSVCSISEYTSTSWTCSCSAGFTLKENQCVKIPEKIFTTTDIVVTQMASSVGPGKFVTGQMMDHIIGFNVTDISATIYGKDSGFFSVNVLNDSYIDVRVLAYLHYVKSSYELTVIVKVILNKIVIQDNLKITLKIFEHPFHTDVYLFDGMPFLTLVGQLFPYRDWPYQYEIHSEQNLSISIDQWGYIRTSEEIHLDTIISPSTIAGYNILRISFTENGTTFYVTSLDVIYLRKYFILEEQIEENSPANTTLGYFMFEYLYMIVQHDKFFVRSGKLLLGNMTLDYESRPYVVETIAIKTYSGFHFNVTIQFKVKDTNDKFPYFLREPYNFVIAKSAPKDMVIGVVQASDPDTESELNYTINPNDILTIDDKGILTLKQNITVDKYTTRVTVHDGLHANTTDITISAIEIKVADQNSSLGRHYNGSVYENTLSPYIVSVYDAEYENYRFSASSQVQNNFHLNSTTGVIRNTRPFDRENINERLFRYSVTANKINQVCSITVLGEVVITVLDVNDNPPFFPTNRYNGSVKEEQPPNEKVRFQVYPVISADDLDENKSLEYSLANGTSYFHINKNTAEIVTTRRLDREVTQTMIITVVAFDGLHRSNATVNITIEDINDNSPTFTIANNFSLYENTSLGNIYRVFAWDPDEDFSGDVTYSIDSQKGYFRIDRDKGDILLAEHLDREEKDLHEIHITARDHGTPQLLTTTTLFVEVLDVNDNAPVFRTHEMILEVDENNDCSQPVMTVNATDKDFGKNGQIQFEFVGNDTNYVGLNISLNGTITCSQSFDFEQERFRYLYVRAMDLGTPPLSSTQLITIAIKDLNDNFPQFGNIIEILEIRYYKSNHERVVAVVNAFDLDSSDNLWFSLSGNASNFLHIDNRGLLRTNTFRIPSIGSYNLNINVSDSVHYSGRSLTVHVLESDNFDQQVRFSRQVINMSIPENKMSGTAVYNVSSLLLTSDNSLTYMYNILEKDDNVPFNLSSELGEVKNTEVLDREKTETFEFVVYVHASNNTEILDLALVNVSVEDTNDNRPEFVKPHRGYFFEVNENDPIGTLVKPRPNHQNIIATDADIGENAQIIYRHVNESACNSSFAINDSTGLLTLINEIDYEIIDHCQLNIMAENLQAIDPPQDFDEITVTVSVQDINDNAPQFQKNKFILQYEEDKLTDILLPSFGNVTDKDARANADVEVRIISSENCLFTVHVAKYFVAKDDGTKTPFIDPELGSVHELSISLTTALDYDTGERNRSCIIIVIDKAENPSNRLTSTATIIIEVTDVNDNYPKIDVDSIKTNISRYEGVDYVVVDRIHATDIDSGNNGEIYFRFDTTDEHILKRFSINDTSGQITLTSSLYDYHQDEVKLIVVVSDKGDPPRFITLLVTIEIKDDNVRPYFNSNSSLVARITEHRLGFSHSFRAFDVVNNVESICDCHYEIVSVNVDRYQEMLDVRTYIDSSGIKVGEIRFIDLAQSSFDREEIPGGTLIVIVKATDHGDPRKSETADLTIEVADINDQAPIFEVPGYDFDIYQQAQIGSYIGTVSAVDRDESPLTFYSLNITDTNFNHTLTIDKTTGVIAKSADMNITEISDVHIRGFVYAKDGENERLPEDHAVITVTVKYYNNNNNTPYFIGVPQTPVNIGWEQEPKKVFATVYAFDNDDGEEGKVSYIIKEGNRRDFFDINIIDGKGNIFLKYWLDSSVKETENETTSIVRLIIEAKDNGTIPKANTTTVTIRIGGNEPLPCVSGDLHEKSVQDLQKEQEKWSYALYGLCGALCISLLTTFVILYKWKSASGLPLDSLKHENKNKKMDDKGVTIRSLTPYESLGQAQKENHPYSVSNQQFDPNGRGRKYLQGDYLLPERYQPSNAHDNEERWRPIDFQSESRHQISRDRQGTYIDLDEPASLISSYSLRIDFDGGSFSHYSVPEADYD